MVNTELLNNTLKLLGAIAQHLIQISLSPRLVSAHTSLIRCEEALRRLVEEPAGPN